MRTQGRNGCLAGEFHETNRLLSSDGRKVREEVVERFAPLQVVQKTLHQDARTPENGRTAHHFGMSFDDVVYGSRVHHPLDSTPPARPASLDERWTHRFFAARSLQTGGTTSCRDEPSPSIPSSTTSPAFRYTGSGLMPMPTPAGVPVLMTSPGSSVMNWLT